MAKKIKIFVNLTIIVIVYFCLWLYSNELNKLPTSDFVFYNFDTYIKIFTPNSIIIGMAVIFFLIGFGLSWLYSNIAFKLWIITTILAIPPILILLGYVWSPKAPLITIIGMPIILGIEIVWLVLKSVSLFKEKITKIKDETLKILAWIGGIIVYGIATFILVVISIIIYGEITYTIPIVELKLSIILIVVCGAIIYTLTYSFYNVFIIENVKNWLNTTPQNNNNTKSKSSSTSSFWDKIKWLGKWILLTTLLFGAIGGAGIGFIFVVLGITKIFNMINFKFFAWFKNYIVNGFIVCGICFLGGFYYVANYDTYNNLYEDAQKLSWTSWQKYIYPIWFNAMNINNTWYFDTCAIPKNRRIMLMRCDDNTITQQSPVHPTAVHPTAVRPPVVRPTAVRPPPTRPTVPTPIVRTRPPVRTPTVAPAVRRHTTRISFFVSSNKYNTVYNPKQKSWTQEQVKIFRKDWANKLTQAYKKYQNTGKLDPKIPPYVILKIKQVCKVLYYTSPKKANWTIVNCNTKNPSAKPVYFIYN